MTAPGGFGRDGAPSTMGSGSTPFWQKEGIGWRTGILASGLPVSVNQMIGDLFQTIQMGAKQYAEAAQFGGGAPFGRSKDAVRDAISGDMGDAAKDIGYNRDVLLDFTRQFGSATGAIGQSIKDLTGDTVKSMQFARAFGVDSGAVLAAAGTFGRVGTGDATNRELRTIQGIAGASQQGMIGEYTNMMSDMVSSDIGFGIGGITNITGSGTVGMVSCG